MSPSVLSAAYERAEDCFARGEYRQARAAYADVLEAAFAVGDGARLAVLTSMQRLAEIAVLAGDWDAAVERLTFARSGFADAGAAFMVDCVSVRIAAVHNARGAGRAADAVLRTLQARPSVLWDGLAATLPAWESEWHLPAVSGDDRALFFSQHHLEAGQVAAYGGQFEKATTLLRRGIDWSRASDAAALTANALSLALGSAYLQKGDVASASACLALVPVDLDERTHPGDRVSHLEVTGRLYLLTGKLGSAKNRLEQALALCRRTGFDAAWRNAALNLAQVLVMLNQTQEARRLCREVVHCAQAGHDAATQVRASYIEALSDERTRSLAGGVSLAPSVTEMWVGRQEGESAGAEAEPTPFDVEESADYLTLFEERALGFFWLLSRGHLDRARSYLVELEAIFEGSEPPTDSLLIRMRLHSLACLLAYYDGRHVEAHDGLQALCTMLRDLGLRTDLWQALRFLQWTLIRLDRVKDADEAGRESMRVLAAMTESLAEGDAVFFLLNKWTDAERYMASEIETLIAMKRRLAEPHLTARLRRPWRRYEMARRLAALLDYANEYRSAIFERPSGADPATPRARSRLAGWLGRLFRHPRSRATVAWIVLPDMTLVARASWMSLDFGVSGTSKLQLRESVKQWHQAARDQDGAQMLAVSRRLSTALQIDEVMRTLPTRVRTIAFVPDDVLHGVPFAALRYRSATGNDQYVGATHATIIAFEWLPPAQSARPGCGATVVGIPYGSGPYAALPGARAEADRVAATLRGRGCPVTCTETHADTVAALPSATLFHIACHGWFQPDNVDSSGLVFISPTGDVDLLTVRQIARLDLHGMEQAVLSGCWAADNFILPGRWIVSLPSALCRRGVRRVVASLWEVDDRIGERIFSSLYTEPADVPVEERLLRIRQQCIDGTLTENGELLDDPFYWAGAQVYLGG